jgi:hypothetical protein
MGEVILNGSSSKLDVTTELQSFGLIVTAEPYFGVTQPSDVVVMENFVRADTQGKVEVIEAKYELLPRGQYTINVLPVDLKPIALDSKVPLDLFQHVTPCALRAGPAPTFQRRKAMTGRIPFSPKPRAH